MGQGLTNALHALCHAAYRLALVTMRPTLVETVTVQLGALEVSIAALDERNRDQQPQTIIARCFGQVLNDDERDVLRF